MMSRVHTASPQAPGSMNRRFRIAVIVASVVAAIVGSVLLATRDSGKKTTTLGVSSTLRVTDHPGSVVAGPDAVWVALADAHGPVRDRPLVRIEIATGNRARPPVHLGGQASHLAHVGDKLIASIHPVGSDEAGPTHLIVLDWRTGTVLLRREFDEPIAQVVSSGTALWALETLPGRLLRLDPSTLALASAPLALTSGRTFGLASGAGYLWVTASDAGQVLRIDPATHAIKHVPVGGFPTGIVVTGGSVWYADSEHGNVVRLDPSTLQSVGDPVAVSAKPISLAAATGFLFVADQNDGTVTLIDAQSGKKTGLPVRVAPSSKGTAAPTVTPAGQSVWVSSFASNTLTRINSTAAATTGSPAAPLAAGGTMTLDISGSVNADATNGAVALVGRFTVTGAITDKGTDTAYLTAQPTTDLLRHVMVGKKGTINLLVTIPVAGGAKLWKITSGTRAYKGLHGNGTEDSVFTGDTAALTLTGMVFR
jgi:streptogramin lyase